MTTLREKVETLMLDGRERTINDVANRLKVNKKAVLTELMRMKDAGQLKSEPLHAVGMDAWRKA
jgi:predicted ArsR family transcriptional regulator